MKEWAELHFDEQVWVDHRGVLNQTAGVAIASRDKKLQRMTQGLDIRAADAAWAWVSYMKQQGLARGEVFRPELGPLCRTSRSGVEYVPLDARGTVYSAAQEE